MKIVVTGAAGFLGNNLIRKLILRDDEIIATDLHATSARSLADISITKIDADILDETKMTALMQDCDIVFHTAAKVSLFPDHDKSMQKINVDGTRSVANAALKAKVKKFIHASSIHALSKSPMKETITETRPHSNAEDDFDYDLTKAQADLMLQEMATQQGLPLIIIYPTGLLGPYDFQPSLSGLAYKDYFHKKILPAISGGHRYVDVRDVADALVACIEHGKIGGRYIIAGENWIPIKKLAKLFSEVGGKKGVVVNSPLWLAKLFWPLQVWLHKLAKKPFPFSKESLRQLVTHKHISIEKAKQELHYRPRPIRETALAMKEWFQHSISD